MENNYEEEEQVEDQDDQVNMQNLGSYKFTNLCSLPVDRMQAVYTPNTLFDNKLVALNHRATHILNNQIRSGYERNDFYMGKLNLLY